MTFYLKDHFFPMTEHDSIFLKNSQNPNLKNIFFPKNKKSLSLSLAKTELGPKFLNVKNNNCRVRKVQHAFLGK
jgi:hypothetical protein